MKLNKIFKAAWLKKLLSGNYRQTTGCLKDTNNRSRPHYCCLGVAGCVLKEMGLAEWGNNGELISLSDGGSNDSILPRQLREKIGLSNDAQDHLMEMNDDEGKNFREIADYIKKL